MHIFKTIKIVFLVVILLIFSVVIVLSSSSCNIKYIDDSGAEKQWYQYS